MQSKDDNKATQAGHAQVEGGPTARIAAPEGTGSPASAVRSHVALAPVEPIVAELESISVDGSVVELLDRSESDDAPDEALAPLGPQLVAVAPLPDVAAFIPTQVGAPAYGTASSSAAPSPASDPTADPAYDGSKTSVPVSLADPRVGLTLLGRYRLDKLIGKGGMGRVYRATQFPLNRAVAVKILSPEFQKKDPQFVRRFFLEAASAARLTHPNTITVFDYGESESGELFIVMEYLRGRPLSRLISQEGPLPPDRTLHIATQVCRALREAHGKGIIHRDLKPGNILLLEEGDDVDFVKVLDFGLVKVFTPPDSRGHSNAQEPLTPGAGVEAELTKAGMFLGSPKYMSPEQIQGAAVDPRTDIYSLGVLMFQMTAGKVPFLGSSSVEVIYKHVNSPLPWLRTVNPAIDPPEELEAVIRRCLEKRADKRFGSMGELLVRLKELRRSLTGVSLASMTGAGLDFRSQARRAPSDESQVSFRPQTRPGSGAHLGSHVGPSAASGAGVVARPITRQRAIVFGPEASMAGYAADLALGTELQASVRPSSALRPGRLLRAAPFLAAVALVLALGLLAFVLATPYPWTFGAPDSELASRPGQRASEAAEAFGADSLASPAPASSARVRFWTQPSGAQVLVDGAVLGRTPFERTFPRDTDSSDLHDVRFQLEGYRVEQRRIRFDGRPLTLDVELFEAASSKVPSSSYGRSPPNAQEEDYKDNPY